MSKLLEDIKKRCREILEDDPYFAYGKIKIYDGLTCIGNAIIHDRTAKYVEIENEKKGYEKKIMLNLKFDEL
jgi:hypothetical protein